MATREKPGFPSPKHRRREAILNWQGPSRDSWKPGLQILEACHDDTSCIQTISLRAGRRALVCDIPDLLRRVGVPAVPGARLDAQWVDGSGESCLHGLL